MGMIEKKNENLTATEINKVKLPRNSGVKTR